MNGEQREAVIDEVLGLEPAEQEAALARLRQEQPEVADEIVALRADAERHWLGELPTILYLDEQAPLPCLQLSTLLGDFEVLGELGRGGMGVVYRARQIGLERNVALKVILAGELASDEQRRRFENEAKLLGSLQHPHIVQVISYGQHEKQPYLVMELVANGNLEKCLEQGPLAVAEAVKLVAVLARAVQAAHEKGIVHRDLKPANVLLGPEVAGDDGNVAGGYPKITDFGLARLIDNDVARTVSGAIVGTPEYMAPEQAAGSGGEVGPAADVWALGVILYRALSGNLPFAGGGILDVLVRARLDPARPLREVCPKVHADLEKVCLGCLEKAPKDRPSAEELAEALETFARDGKVRLPVKGRSCRTAVVVGGALAASVLVLALGLAAWLFPREGLKSAGGGPPAVKLRVLHYQRHNGDDLPVGEIGTESFATHYDDRVVLHVETARPMYCFLIGCNYDGKEQLLWPCDEEQSPHPGDAERLPPSRARFQYPPPARTGADGKPRKPKCLALNDDKKGGMQAFVLVTAERPLPSYAEWKKERGAMPWQALPATPVVWWSDGEVQDRLAPGGVRARGSVEELKGQAPLLQLCGWAKGKDANVVEALTFPVFGQGGNR